MGKVTVWTRQNQKVLENLNETGRHVATKRAVHQSEEAMTMIAAYDWLAKAIPDQKSRPADAAYPVWVSFEKRAVTLPSKNTVLLELEVEEHLITRLNIAKWGAVNNCAYIPADEEDRKNHKEKMEALGVNDVKACTTNFYP